MPDSASSPVAADRDSLRDTLAQDNSALARIGPILLQVQRAQRVSSGITPTPEMNSESGDGGAQEDSRNADEPEE